LTPLHGVVETTAHMPALDGLNFQMPDTQRLFLRERSTHPPRFLMRRRARREREGAVAEGEPAQHLVRQP
jgi:hypothetical protein